MKLKFYDSYYRHINVNMLFSVKCQFLFCLTASLLSLCQSGLVAYSTELDRKENAPYSVPLNTYQEIWQIMFRWAFFSVFIAHILASTLATATLRKHKYGR